MVVWSSRAKMVPHVAAAATRMKGECIVVLGVDGGLRDVVGMRSEALGRSIKASGDSVVHPKIRQIYSSSQSQKDAMTLKSGQSGN